MTQNCEDSVFERYRNDQTNTQRRDTVDLADIIAIYRPRLPKTWPLLQRGIQNRGLNQIKYFFLQEHFGGQVDLFKQTIKQFGVRVTSKKMLSLFGPAGPASLTV